MLNTSFNPNQFLTAVIDPNKTAQAACEAFREAIAMTVVTNTAVNSRNMMDACFLEMLQQEAKHFACSNHIVIMKIDSDDGKTRLFRRFDFSLVDDVKRLELLQELANNLKTAYYEDVVSFDFDGNNYHGFCWKGANAGYMVGYFIEPESQPGDWDYDSEATSKQADNIAATSTYKGDLEAITNAGATWNAACAAYEHGVAFDIDAINQMVVDIVELKKTTKSWKIKDMCQKLLVSLSEYGFQ